MFTVQSLRLCRKGVSEQSAAQCAVGGRYVRTSDEDYSGYSDDYCLSDVSIHVQ